MVLSELADSKFKVETPAGELHLMRFKALLIGSSLGLIFTGPIQQQPAQFLGVRYWKRAGEVLADEGSGDSVLLRHGGESR